MTQPNTQGPDFIALQVTDLDAARRFWIEVVGLSPAPVSPPGAVVFATEPVTFAITKPKLGLGASPKLGWGVSLWIHTQDTDALHETLVGAGTPILAPPTVGPFGRQLTFQDPAGYVVVAHDGTDLSRSTIRPDRPLLTLVNVFEVEPERQREFVDLLERATEETMRHCPGFVSANLHRSLDGQRVVNYAQWRSREDFKAMLADPEAQVHMRQASAMAKATPVLCEVSSVH